MESVIHQRQLWQEATVEALDAVQQAGVTVIRPDKGPFQAAVLPLYDTLEDSDLGQWAERIRALRDTAADQSIMTRVIDRSLGAILITLMIIMVITVSWQVITRYLLNSPSSYTEELATYLLIWISLLGAAYALRVRAHLGIDVLVRRMRQDRQRSMRLLAHVVVIVFSLVALVFGGSWLVYVTLDLNQLSAAFQLPIGYVYLVLPLSGLLMTYYSVIAMLEQRRVAHEPPTP